MIYLNRRNLRFIKQKREISQIIHIFLYILFAADYYESDVRKIFL